MRKLLSNSKKYIFESNLRRYIKNLIEGIDPEELASLENKYEKEIKKKPEPGGWDMLNFTIEKLEEIEINPIPELMDKFNEIQNVLTSLGFKKMGEGAFRDVWGSPSANFVVKIEKSQQRSVYDTAGTNKAETDTYFKHGTDFQPRNDMFPKLYAYDRLDDMWSIFEKVYTFGNCSKDVPLKMFAPLIDTLTKAAVYLYTDPFFKSIKLKNDPNVYILNFKEYKFKELTDISSCTCENVMNIVWTDFIRRMIFQMSSADDAQISFEDILCHYMIDMLDNNSRTAVLRNDELNRVFTNRLLSYFRKNLKVPPDAAWISNFFKQGHIDDLHLGNIGYRDLKNNPSEPWKNLVILDFGEYGGGGSYYYNSSYGSYSSIPGFVFKPLTFS